MLDGKMAEKLHTKCYKMHTLQICTQCVYKSIYICTIKQKTSFTVLSPPTLSLKKLYQFSQTPSHRQSLEYGMAQVLQAHVSRKHRFLHLQFFNSLHAFEAFANVVHKWIDIPMLVNIPSTVSHSDGLFFQMRAL